MLSVETKGLFPQCVECGLFQRNVNLARRLELEDCKKHAEIQGKKSLDLLQNAGTDVSLADSGQIISNVRSFKYFGRIFSDTDDN